MDDHKPEVLFDATAVKETSRDTEQDDDPGCEIAKLSLCMGSLVLEEGKLLITMGWHVAHEVSKARTKEFLRYRCYALRDAFGHLKGVTGIRIQDDEEWAEHPVAGKPKVGTYSMTMGYYWPNIEKCDWQEFKLRFLEIFMPASLNGNVLCTETATSIHLVGEFKLPQKGQSDA